MTNPVKVVLLLVALAVFGQAGIYGDTEKREALPAMKVLSGTPDYSRDMDQTFPIRPGAAVRVEHAMGPVEVIAGGEKIVRVEARIEVKGEKAEAFGKEIRIEVREKGDPFEIETRYPEGKWKNLSYGVRLRVTVPKGHALLLTNRFGGIEVRGMAGDVEAETRFGAIEVEKIQGNTRLTAAFGDIRLRDARGSARIEGTNGAVRVEDLSGGDLTVKNKFGTVEISNTGGAVTVKNLNGAVTVKGAGGKVVSYAAFGDQVFEEVSGALEAEGKNGSIHAKQVAGTARVKNAFGSIVLEGVEGDVEAKDTNGKVVLKAVEGSARVENSFGPVEVEDLSGDGRIAARNGPVSVRGVKGDLEVESTFGPVRVEGAGGDVIVESSNGNVRVEGIAYRRGKTGEGNRIVLSASLGMVTLILPEPPSFTLEAAASLGHIRSGFDLPGIRREGASESCRSRLGDGAAEIRIHTSGGDIRLEKGNRVL